MKRREFLKRTSLIASTAMLPACKQKLTSKTTISRNIPNVLLIKTDEHNPKISGPYGHSFVKTPNMDRLAKRGVVFENSYCNSPLCLPSRSSFMSGRYVHEIKTYNNCNIFQYDYPTHGRILSDNDIYTVLVGKVDVYNHSSTLGFDEVILPKDRKQPGDINISRSPLCIRPKASEHQIFYGTELPPHGDEAKNYLQDDKKIQAATNWINTKGVELDKPWYLEVNLYAPHYPHLVKDKMWEYYKDHADLPEYDQQAQTSQHPYMQDFKKHFETESFSENNIRGLRRGYYGCVTQIDDQIGRVLKALEDSGQLDSTVIVYTSDHGEMLGKFGLWWKGPLLEDSAKVPLIISGPGFEKNSRFNSCVDQLDLQATLFDIFNVPMPESRHGRSLLNREDDDENTVAFSEYQGHGVRGSSFMVRRGDFKYIWYYNAQDQLFNLKDDPNELDNLALNMPDKVLEMKQILYKLCDPQQQQLKSEAYIEKQLGASREYKLRKGT
jgi:choline-sulfatase